MPEPGNFYMPVQCQQCENPPCVKVCPVQATWKEPDGIVVIDYDWCIGCRYCMAACPYGARHFNWAEPDLPKEELNPDTHYLGNRPRPKGVVEKCTFCIQRTREGRYPACVEICPVGARKFGNLLDPDSEIRHVMETKRVFIFKEDLDDAAALLLLLRDVGGARRHDRHPRASSRGCARLVSPGEPRLLRVAGRARRRHPASALVAYAHQFRTGLIATNMRDQVSLGLLHRQLHLPGGRGRGGGAAGHPRLRLPLEARSRRS